MQLLISYKIRLAQLVNGSPELYHGETQVIQTIITGYPKDTK